MRICLKCGQGLLPDNWQCSSCHFQPLQQDGFRLFAPGLAEEHEGFPAGKYPALAKVESENFWFRSRNKLIVRILSRHFGNQKSFLEIGCGTGFVLSGVAAAFPEARMSASEIDLAGLPFVRQRVARAEIFQMDACQIPFKDEFDVIGAFDVIEHIEEDEKVLNQIYNACKPGGGVIITVPQHPWLWSPLDTHSHHKRRYTKKELVGKIKEAGFEVAETFSFVSLLMPFMWLSRLKSASGKDYDPMRELALPKFINWVFCRFMDLERVLFKAGVQFPLGGSLLCVANKT